MVDDDEKLKETILTSGQNREMWFLTENGLYEVLMQSCPKEFRGQVKINGIAVFIIRPKTAL